MSHPSTPPPPVELPAASSSEEHAHDLALMERVVRGDVSAFEALYDRHAPRALALCLRILRQRADAEEVLHDAFCEAFCAAAHFEPGRGSVATWLLVRVRSRALDRRIRQKREPLLRDDPDDMGVGGAHGREPPGLEQQVALREALHRLEPALLTTLELRYFEGLTAPEVAQRMGVPEGTVKSRLARALAALQHWLRGENDEGAP